MSQILHVRRGNGGRDMVFPVERITSIFIDSNHFFAGRLDILGTRMGSNPNVLLARASLPPGSDDELEHLAQDILPELRAMLRPVALDIFALQESDLPTAVHRVVLTLDPLELRLENALFPGIPVGEFYTASGAGEKPDHREE